VIVMRIKPALPRQHTSPITGIAEALPEPRDFVESNKSE
jgi:hypothetical protein